MSTLSQLDLNLLVVLDVLLAEGSVSLAARRLHLTQPAVSHALGRARAVLGDPLLVRRGNRLVRTPLAEGLAEPLRLVLADLESVLAQRLVFDPATDRRTFRLALTDYSGLLLPPLIAAVRGVAPGVSFEVHPFDLSTFAGALERGDIDLAVSVLPAAPGVVRRPLFEDRHVVLARRDHPVTAGPLDVAGYCRFPHLVTTMGTPGVPGAVDRALASVGAVRTVGLRVPSFALGPPVVAASDLLMTLPRRLAQRAAAAHGLAVLEPPVPMAPFTVGVGWSTRRDRDPATVWLVGHVEANVPEGIGVSDGRRDPIVSKEHAAPTAATLESGSRRGRGRSGSG